MLEIIGGKSLFFKGKSISPIKRINLVTGKPFGDGDHILHVNGEYRGASDIGKLMHDFNCTNADDMNFELMAERTRYLKKNPEGVSEMCKVIEDMRREEREEGIKEGLRATALRMLKARKYALDEIAECAGLPLDEVKKLQANHHA